MRRLLAARVRRPGLGVWSRLACVLDLFVLVVGPSATAKIPTRRGTGAGYKSSEQNINDDD